jgi:hypothetical protein
MIDLSATLAALAFLGATTALLLNLWGILDAYRDLRRVVRSAELLPDDEVMIGGRIRREWIRQVAAVAAWILSLLLIFMTPGETGRIMARTTIVVLVWSHAATAVNDRLTRNATRHVLATRIMLLGQLRRYRERFGRLDEEDSHA